MGISNAEYIKNSIQGERIFTFFEKSPKRNTLKTPSPKRMKIDQVIPKPVLRRSTRLKSQAFVDSVRKDVYDITRADLDSPDREFKPLKRRNTISIAYVCNTKSTTMDKINLGATGNKDSKRRKTSQSTLNMPLRRSTRLKSAIPADNSPKNLLYNTRRKTLKETDLTLDVPKSLDAKQFAEREVKEKMANNLIEEPNSKLKSKTQGIQNSELYVNEEKIVETSIQLKSKQSEKISKLITNKISSLQAKSCKYKTPKRDKENEVSKKNCLKFKNKTKFITTLDVNNSPSNISSNVGNLQKSGKALVETRKRTSRNSNKNDSLINSEGPGMQFDKMAIKSKAFVNDIMHSGSISGNYNLQVNETSSTSGVENASKRNEIKIQALNIEGKKLPAKNTKQVSKKCPKRRHATRISKLTKEQIKDVNKKKIPKDRLFDVLDMMNNDFHPIWDDRNESCNPSIHLYWEPKTSLISDHNIKLKYARQFILQRDWVSLSKVLCLSNLTSKTYYPLFSKYAALLLAHTDKEQFKAFTQFLVNIDVSTIMKKCTKI